VHCVARPHGRRRVCGRGGGGTCVGRCLCTGSVGACVLLLAGPAGVLARSQRLRANSMMILPRPGGLGVPGGGGRGMCTCTTAPYLPHSSFMSSMMSAYSWSSLSSSRVTAGWGAGAGGRPISQRGQAEAHTLPTTQLPRQRAGTQPAPHLRG
jgi:hypothetical protein